MMSETTYQEMKRLVHEYEQRKLFKNITTEVNVEKPYIDNYFVDNDRKYNTNYGDNRMCVCGHVYYRHFDTYEQMEAVGCKYCGCQCFEEKTN